ncbi:ATP-dependent DNA helicase [Sergentomyia squamirostris]
MSDLLDMTMDSEDDEALLEIVDISSDESPPKPPVSASASQPSEDHLKVLRKNFGHTNFRPLQWEIIDSVLNHRKDNLAVMATGYGKSLCYQYPSIYTGKLTIVVSPLVSLMEDQVSALQVLNIDACFLGEAQKDRNTLDNVRNGMFRLVYMSPEYITNNQKVLEDLLPQLTLIAIDEAHCVSQWGHDFRPAFRALSFIRKKAPGIPILAMTATATQRVREDIINTLGLINPQCRVTGFDRPNLMLEIHSRLNIGPWADLRDFVRSVCSGGGSAIIYCLTRNETESVANELMKHEIPCEPYHAGLTFKNRTRVHQDFLKDRVKIIVATVAFGMGIDKPDVRMVIHYGCSQNLESYYQEIGRAGRDGKPSRCILLYHRKDFVTHSILWEHSSTKQNLQELQGAMKDYTELRTCRRRFILEYFDDNQQKTDLPKETCCDNCKKKLFWNPEQETTYVELNSEGKFNFLQNFTIFLNAFQVFGRYTSVAKTVLLLRASKAAKLNSQYYSHALYGSGKDKSEQWWKLVADMLIRNGFLTTETVKSQPRSFTITKLTRKGQEWLGQKEDVFLHPLQEMMKFFTVKSAPQIVKPGVAPLFSFAGPSTSGQNPPVSVSQKNLSQKNFIPSTITKANQETELMKGVMLERSKLASEVDCMPYVIASTTALEQMCQVKPRTLEEFRQANFDGFSEAKIQKFGPIFVKFFRKFLDSQPEVVPVESETPEKSELDLDMDVFESIEEDILRQAELMDRQSLETTEADLTDELSPSPSSQKTSRKLCKKYAQITYLTDDEDDEDFKTTPEDDKKENKNPSQSVATPSPMKKRKMNLKL